MDERGPFEVENNYVIPKWEVEEEDLGGVGMGTTPVVLDDIEELEL